MADIECTGCGKREPLKLDPVVQLPDDWHRHGKRLDGTSIILCPACHILETAARKAVGDAP
jgi:hypothetical protein